VETAVQTCYRHPERRAGVVCQRCDRPICPDCMHQASVGFHCPECARAGAQRVLRPQDLGPGRPVVAIAFVLISAAVFLAEPAIDSARDTPLWRDGALNGPLVAAGEWWRIITSGFLHANLMHVGFNCFLAYQLGLLLEPAIGRLRFGLVYVAGLVGGSLGALLLSSPGQFTLGASGAVFGLMGAAVVAMRSRGIDIFQTGIGALLLLNLFITFVIPGISIGGHLGGLAAGLVAATILEGSPQLRRAPAAAVTALVAAQVVATFGLALVVAG
jgi:membrane associated rhomboid family serine protease